MCVHLPGFQSTIPEILAILAISPTPSWFIHPSQIGVAFSGFSIPTMTRDPAIPFPLPFHSTSSQFGVGFRDFVAQALLPVHGFTAYSTCYVNY